MKKITLLGLFILFTTTIFAKSTELNLQFRIKLDTDTISNPKIISGATYICNEQKCLGEQIKKIESFTPQSYMILYKISDTKFVKVRQGIPISSILKHYKLNEIAVMDGKIEISGIKYDVDHLVILR